MLRLDATPVRLGAFAALMAALPFLLTNPYYVSVLILCVLHAMVTVGLSLLLGFAGQISLGHAAFYGIGAYATAVATASWGLPVWAGCLIGVGLAVGVAVLVGVPALKLTGHYLAMATLGFGIIVFIVLNETVSVTGGPSGFVGIPRLELFGLLVDSELAYYYVVSGVLVAVLMVSLNLLHSRVGRALRAIHTSEKAAQSVGVDAARFKLFIFVLSAGFAALAGVLYAHYLEFVAPSSFGFMHSVLFITMVVLGGMESVWGAVAGAFFLTMLPEFLRVFENIETLIYGGILILCMMFLPGGMAGGAASLYRALFESRERRGGREEGP